MKMASKRITQETFDAVVHENIEEFQMQPEEAIKEAVEQFESQGVDLSNIVKLVPKVSADGSQEPRHDILQVERAKAGGVGEGKAGLLLSREPDVGLNPMILGS